MMWIYILLSIIAVGVLILSEDGKKILLWLAIIIGICLGLYLLFWLVMLLIGFIGNQDFTKEGTWMLLGVPAVVGLKTLWAVFREKKKE